jgi:acyl carrier protein
VDQDAIQQVVLSALRSINLTRPDGSQLEVSPTAALFGPESPLDSLGLVSLLMDVEEGLAERGRPVTLSDERAMSQKRSPFRSVPALVSYIEQLVQEAA